MGVSRSPAELGRKLRAAGISLEKAERSGLRKAAILMRTSINKQVAAVAPGRRLRGVGQSGAKVGARYRIRGNAALVQASGPLHLIEEDTKPHEIRPRRKKAILTPAGPRARANHPGTRGKKPFAKGAAIGAPLVAKTFQQEVRAQLGRVFH